MSNLLIRSLTGVVYVAVILCGLSHTDIFPFVFGAAAGLTLWEFYGLMGAFGYTPLRKVGATIGGVYLFLASFAYVNGWADGSIFLPYILFLMSAFILELYGKAACPVHNWAFILLGQVYCAAPFALLNFMLFQPAVGGRVEFVALPGLALFVFVWLNDSGAYLIGSRLGRRRLFERISPKKSWEGFWGGLIVTLSSSQVFAAYSSYTTWYKWLGMAVVVVVFATWGDLIESLLKRTLGVKDSGSLLPGHGGMLDRLDSILMALPALYIYIMLFI
ncbi:MAG: phosphatidate cytidylyltransferase [Tannerellaceae bacterium]|jgi:phosphatidate cytidylyltransferase|nr:phosphatidate cytidylyltransferase [Tannerellaceae bacterium]